MTDISQYPRANWPSIQGEYKIIQLYIGEQQEPFLRIQTREGEFHSQILRGALREFILSFDFVNGKESRKKIPAPNGLGYKACGMGRAWINPETKTLLPYSQKSDDYDIGTDRKHFEKILPLLDGWEIEF